MRKILLVSVVVISACALPGQARRRPGSNVTLPIKESLVSSVAKSIACSAQARDSLTPATSTGRDVPVLLLSSCDGQLRRPVGDPPTAPLP